MNCPSCGQPQPDGSTECASCGVIFAKWKARVAGQGSAPSAPAAASVTASAEVQWGAVLKGAFIGVILTFVASNLVAMPFMSGMPTTPAEAAAAMKALMENQSYLWSDLGASLLCMAIGGYIAAGADGSSGFKQGAATGFLLVCWVGAMYMMAPHLTPGWYNAAALGLTLPAAALGGMLR